MKRAQNKLAHYANYFYEMGGNAETQEKLVVNQKHMTKQEFTINNNRERTNSPQNVQNCEG